MVPPLPIPNRTVKQLRADDSAATSVKVGHRQAFIRKPLSLAAKGFLLCAKENIVLKMLIPNCRNGIARFVFFINLLN